MAEKILNTRISLKIDTLENWGKSTLPLKKGEIALATVASSAGTGLTEPVVMLKIGEDGVKTFSQLDWNFYAKASDVLSACKTEDGLKTFINNVIAEAGIATDEALTTLAGRVTTAEGKIEKLNGDATTEGSVAKAIADAITALKLEETYLKIADFDTTIQTYDYATKTEAQVYANAKDDAIAEAKKAGTDAQDAVDALSEKVGEVEDGKTIIGMIADAQDAATYDDTEIQGKVNTLIGEDANKSVRTIANEELAAQLITEDAAENLNSLQEIAAWIQSHPNDASAMNEAIVALQKQLNGIDAGEGTVKKYIDDAISALNVGQYALASDLTALAGRVQTLENASHTHDNKDLLDTYTQTEENLADAVAKKHEHTNKAVLDNIDQAKFDAIGTAVQTVTASADSGLVATKTGTDVAISIDDSLTFVFDCGDAEVSA